MDELIERIRTAQDKMLEEKLTANTVVLNDKKYGCLFELGFRPSICGLTAELAPLPDNMEFIVQRREPKPMTNADRIRSMSDEELAVEATAHGGCPHNCETPDDMDTDCVKCWLGWLEE